MASWWTYVQIIIYLALLFFMIPIQIKDEHEYSLQFEEYLKRFNKTYDQKEYPYRFNAFKKSLAAIESFNFNKSNDSARYGLTKFSDLSVEEFTADHLKVSVSHLEHSRPYNRKRETLRQKVDWRQKNAVTKVKDQHACGACWAYSAVETIESMNAIKGNKLREFSVQEMIDCAGYNNDGCNGGDVCSSLAWMKDMNFTIHYKSKYNTKSGCKSNSVNGAQLEDYVCDSLVGSEDVIMNILGDIGPVAVAVNAQSWQNYIGGVIEYHCDGSLQNMNHAVQIVGYDLTTNIPHYIVRNTWGEDFGDGGYLYIAVGKNMCGVANEVSALKVL